MPISVACPTCGAKLKTPDNAAGKKIKCPKCEKLIDVPADGEETAAVAAAAPDEAEGAAEDMADVPPAGEDAGEPLADAGDSGGPLREDDKLWGMLAHLAGGLFGWLGALIVFLIKKDESPFLRHHTKESLNFQITMIIGWLVAIFVSCCMGCGGKMIMIGNEIIGYLIYLASSLPYMAVGVASLIMAVLQALKARNGEWSKYPFAIRLIK